MDATECELINELKLLCHENGSEVEPCKSAMIFHKLGNLYADRPPDKVRFIQSATLLNAALHRDPINAEKPLKDLKLLCFKILSESKAENSQADLVDISNTVYRRIRKFRDSVKNMLETIPILTSDLSENQIIQQQNAKIEKMQQIQDYITDEYSKIMCCIANYCKDILGRPPCKFAVVGMGSLARSEITPFSDFENVLVLEDGFENSLGFEYFRWFAVIFQIILVNFGETLIPSVAIPSLNDFQDKTGLNNWFYDKFTKSGISFDGLMPHACKHPLGRSYETENRAFTTELIRTASGMAEYIDSEEDLKNGYHLADVLTQTCFVYGEKSVYDRFNELCKSKLKMQRCTDYFINQLIEQVDEDKERFEIWKSLEELHRNLKCNMKQIVYRSVTIFLSALGKMHEVESPSSFSVVKELATRGLISAKDEHKLLYAVAIACEVRLRVYMKEGRANNQITKGVAHNRDYLTELFDLIGERSTVDYFNIAHSLQAGLPDFKAAYKLSFPEIPFTVPAIYYFLNDYEKSIECFRSELKKDPNNIEKRIYAQFRVGFSFLYLRKYKEAVKEFLDVQDFLTDYSDVESQTTLKKTNVAIADCYRSLKMYDNALKHYQLAQPLESVIEENNLGVVYLKLKKYLVAGEHFARTIEDFKKNGNGDRTILAMLIYNRGRCYQEDRKYEDALTKFRESLNMRKEVSRDYDLDENIASTRYNIGRCHLHLGDLDLAEEEIKAAIDIQNRLPEKRSDPVISDSYHYYGRCLFFRENYNEALDYFEQERDIRKRLPVEQNTDVDSVANCYQYIAICCDKLEQKAKARSFYDMEKRERKC